MTTSPSTAASAHDGRTARLLTGPIVPMLLRMAWPNVLVMLAQASIGLIETWWVAHLGTDALAGMALVFPPTMLMSMISAGAVGGAISAAIARALGQGRREDADALVAHAVAINILLGLAFTAMMLIWGRTIYQALGGSGAALEAALIYSNIVFAGNVGLWIMNALASAIRGSGNMLVPALVVSLGVVLLIPLSPLLIFGFGPIPAFGIAGGGIAVVTFNVVAVIVLALYIASGRNPARFRRTRLRWSLAKDILRVGLLGAITSVQTNITIAVSTALVASVAGVGAVAGFGTGARLEYLIVPLSFGLGAPLVALVGTNIGAGQRERALRIALTGGGITFAVTEAIGLATAIWPDAWLGLFTHDAIALATGAAYLRTVGPFYGFFGLGLALYFASQGAGRIGWPLIAGTTRLVIALGGSWLVLRYTGSLPLMFAVLSAALTSYGVIITFAVSTGRWFRTRSATPELSATRRPPQ